MTRVAYRVTGGKGPEWKRLEWIIMQGVNEKPVRQIWDAIEDNERRVFEIINRLRGKPSPPKKILALLLQLPLAMGCVDATIPALRPPAPVQRGQHKTWREVLHDSRAHVERIKILVTRTHDHVWARHERVDRILRHTHSVRT